MSSDFIRWGGLAGIAAGMMYIVAGILNLLDPQSDVFVSLFDYLIEFVFAVAWLGTLGAIASLHAAQREGHGQLGTAGSATAFVGYVLLFVVSVANILAGREVLGIVVLLGLLGVLVGLILLGIAILRTRSLPRWCGVLLIVVIPLTAILNLTINAGGIVQGLVWALIGVTLLSSGQTSSQQPTRVS